MTTIYLIRHSEPFKVHRGIEDVHEEFLFSNIKTPLSVDGEKLAEKVSQNKEFQNIDVVWSSNYVRAMSTAKYFAYNNDLKVNVSDKLGERIHGVNSWDELPPDFERRQFLDENYKIGYGENQKEVRERLYSVIMQILNENKNKRIVIICHATAISFLLKKWCDIKVVDDKLNYSYNGKQLLKGHFNYCETFKLEFDDKNEIVNIENIK